jgi:hypothetical protein
MLARPIGIKTLRPEQVNRGFAIIETKLRKNNNDFDGCGLKVFP